jgi:TRAP-type transport system periplasmic protein
MASTDANIKTGPYNTYKFFTSGVEKASNGRVKFTELVGAVTLPQKYDGLISGLTEIGGNPCQVNTGRFPCSEVMVIPPLFTACARPGMVAREAYLTLPEMQKEFADVHILTMFGVRPSPPGIGFGTKTKAVRNLDDAKGMKMGMYGEWGTKECAALGFVPVAVPNNVVYENLQKGVVEGSFMDPEFIISQNVGEIIKYWHEITILYTPFWWGMNQKTWDSLPADIQKIMTDQAALMPDFCDKFMANSVKDCFAKYPNIEIINYPKAEQDRWNARIAPVQAEFLARLTAKGLDGQKVYDTFAKLYTKYSAPAP